MISLDTIRMRSEYLEKVGRKPAMGSILMNHIAKRRLYGNKNTIIMLVGKNGEGKSWTGLAMAEAMEAPEKFDVEKQIVYTPLQYTQVMDYVLNRKSGKRVVLIDEADKLVSSTKWWGFVEQSISEIQSTYREIKPLVVIYIAPSLRRLNINIREQIDFYGICSRPIGMGTRVRLYSIYSSKTDVEKLKLGISRVRMVVENKPGSWQLQIIRKLVMSKPLEDDIKKYHELSIKFKKKIVQKRMEAILNSIKAEMPDANKIDVIFNIYRQNHDLLKYVVKSGEVKYQPIQKLHQLTKTEAKELAKKLNEYMISIGVLKRKTKLEKATEQLWKNFDEVIGNE